jgi:nitroreductase
MIYEIRSRRETRGVRSIAPQASHRGVHPPGDRPFREVAAVEPVANDTILRQLHWRYATKKFDPTRTIPADDWATLEQALALAPSSYGLQPWKFFVVTDAATKAKLAPISRNQTQVTTCSHLVVFTVRHPMGPEDVDRYVARIAAIRGMSPESLADYRQRMLGSVLRPVEEVRAWAARQAYIALGTFLTSAALLGIDACPMEGIEPTKYDDVLGLTARGYAALCIATAGYRAADDKYAAAAKVRFPVEEVVEHVRA